MAAIAVEHVAQIANLCFARRRLGRIHIPEIRTCSVRTAVLKSQTARVFAINAASPRPHLRPRAYLSRRARPRCPGRGLPRRFLNRPRRRRPKARPASRLYRGRRSRRGHRLAIFLWFRPLRRHRHRRALALCRPCPGYPKPRLPRVPRRMTCAPRVLHRPSRLALLDQAFPHLDSASTRVPAPTGPTCRQPPLPM